MVNSGMAPNPAVIEVTRRSRVESVHTGTAAIVDDSGRTIFSIGDPTADVFPRSAVKPIQALAMVASGAAEHFGAIDAEIALACGSHVGSPAHVATAEGMLCKAGQDARALECGAHWPLDDAEARALASRGEAPSPLHNNCSGKHAGFICLASFRGYAVDNYTRPDHPAMQEVTATLAGVTGATLETATAGTDGCSIPAFAMPLQALALGFARFGTGQGLPPMVAAAAKRIRAAVAACPHMLSGAGRFDTRVAETCGQAILVKSGAEGVACAAIPEARLGIAVKIDDGAGRAATAAMATLLLRFADDWPRDRAEARAILEEFARPVLRNWNGVEVGCLRPTGIFGRG